MCCRLLFGRIISDDLGRIRDGWYRCNYRGYLALSSDEVAVCNSLAYISNFQYKMQHYTKQFKSSP